MIRVGDIVRVTDWGHGYSTCTTWFQKFRDKLDFEWILKYAYGDEAHYYNSRYDDVTKYKVLFISDGRALITFDSKLSNYSKVYLVDINAIVSAEPPVEMTVAEIEEKLGIKNLKIIGEKKDE